MVRKTVLALGILGSVVAATGVWNLYQRYGTETVPYTTVARVEDVELRRYPPTVLVETTAEDEREAFRRLFRYITGANEGDREVSMTAPVEVADEGRTIPMTTPVAVASAGQESTATAPDRSDHSLRMAFYLPSSFDLASAPRPTDDAVDLVDIPARTLAVRRFSGRSTERRINRQMERLLRTLEDVEIPAVDEPFYLGYDAPWTLPFLRRNEVAVEVVYESGEGSS